MILTLVFIFCLFGFSSSAIFFLAKWDKLPVFILINVSILILYCLLIYLFESNYSFGYYFKILSSITLHSFLIFIFSIYKYILNSKNETST